MSGMSASSSHAQLKGKNATRSEAARERKEERESEEREETRQSKLRGKQGSGFPLASDDADRGEDTTDAALRRSKSTGAMNANQKNRASESSLRQSLSAEGVGGKKRSQGQGHMSSGEREGGKKGTEKEREMEGAPADESRKLFLRTQDRISNLGFDDVTCSGAGKAVSVLCICGTALGVAALAS